MIIEFDPKIIFNHAIADILATFFLGVLGLIFLDRQRILNPWVYKYFGGFGQTFIKYLFILLNFIFHPALRIILFLVLLVLINYGQKELYFSLILFLILLSFLVKKKSIRDYLPAAKVSDGFENLNKWERKTGQPTVEENFGKPEPDLGLRPINREATNSFIVLKDISAERGIIECDFNLEPHSLFNIVFFCDKNNDNWYMARYDSRENCSDGFLIKDGGPGVNWRDFAMSGTQTTVRKWHHARIEFDSTRVAMYKDGELLVEFKNPIIFGKSIGLYNEVGHVHVDNFLFIEKN